FYHCAQHQLQCIRIEQQDATAAGSEYEQSHELSVWKLESALAEDHTLRGKGVGVQSTAEWEPEATALVRYGILSRVPRLGVWENTSIVASLYKGKTLTWP
ncbi:MAG: hypothetical protein ACRDV4_07290, partial [Acidimicrobiales bacterium]